MAQKKITDLQLRSSVTDDLNIPSDDGIQSYRVTAAQLKTYITPPVIAPSITRYLSGSGTYNLKYAFVITTGSATAGATYTNNSVTFTVAETVSSGTVVYMTGSGAPSASGTLTKASGTGDTTLTFSQYKKPLYIKGKAVGAGGGGGASGHTSGTGGGNGGNTTFGTSLITCNGGTGGGPGVSNGAGGAGGSVTVNSPAIALISVTGGKGNGGNGFIASGSFSAVIIGPTGGSTPLGGSGSSNYSAASTDAIANTGCGGAGGSAIAGSPSGSTGGAGGGGGYAEFMIKDPSATYAYAVGAAGTAGSPAGTSGQTGGAGGSGAIYLEEHYQ